MKRRHSGGVQVGKAVKCCLIGMGLLAGGAVTAQRQDSLEAFYERKYEERVQQAYLNEVYIPKNLAETFGQLEKLTSRDAREKYRKVPEHQAVRQLHFSLGRWIIYNWGFYEGSRLSHYLKQYGVSHPDDMARFVMTAWHRHLNEKELDLKTLVEELRAIRRILAPQGGWKRDTIERKAIEPPQGSDSTGGK